MQKLSDIDKIGLQTVEDVDN